MDEYTPITEDVRRGYAYSRVLHYYFDGGDEENAKGLREFDRWLAAHDAEMRERVAQEIEADWDREGCGERDFCHGWVHANQSAARIARGETDHRP